MLLTIISVNVVNTPLRSGLSCSPHCSDKDGLHFTGENSASIITHWTSITTAKDRRLAFIFVINYCMKSVKRIAQLHSFLEFTMCLRKMTYRISSDSDCDICVIQSSTLCCTCVIFPMYVNSSIKMEYFSLDKELTMLLHQWSVNFLYPV